MKNPQIAIVIGSESFFAYMICPDGCAELVERINFRSDNQLNASLVRWENEHICYQAITGMIQHVLEQYRPDSWGLACLAEQWAKIQNFLPRRHSERMASCVETDAAEVNIANVAEHFGATPVVA